MILCAAFNLCEPMSEWYDKTIKDINRDMLFDLSGKRALITGVGAPNGIGIAVAHALYELGAEVIITSTSDRIYQRAREIGAADRVQAFVADLTVPSEVQALADFSGSIDILVNNAGMTSVSAPMTDEESCDLTQVTNEAWHLGLSRNVDTAFMLTRAMLPSLRQSAHGRIIFISSVTGGLMAMAHQPVYATAKAALLGLTRSLAVDEGRHGITVNAVLPGWVQTDSQCSHEFEQGLKTPLGRNGKPIEIATAVAWLASSNSGFVTGQSIVIDGGNSVREERA